jgi:hypothetical protein
MNRISSDADGFVFPSHLFATGIRIVSAPAA